MPLRAAVIGAGAAGLCAAKYLLARGVDVVILLPVQRCRLNPKRWGA